VVLAGTALAVAAPTDWSSRQWTPALRARLPRFFIVESVAPGAGSEASNDCPGVGVNCSAARCCNETKLTCFTKNDEYAACKKSCTPGEIDTKDPVDFRTAWSCEVLGGPPPAPAVPAAPPPIPGEPPAVVPPGPEGVVPPGVVPPGAAVPPGVPPGAAAGSMANSGCFLVDVGKLLVVRHSYGTLDIPGGTAELGESPEATACRETFEETGYRVRADGLKKVMPDGFHIFDCHLLAPNPEGSPDPSEVAEVMWRAVLPSTPWRFQEEYGLFSSWLAR